VAWPWLGLGRPKLDRLPYVRPESAAPDLGQGAFDERHVLDAPGFGLVAAKPGWLGTVGTGGASSETVVKLDPTTGGFSNVVSFPTQQEVAEANIVYGARSTCSSIQGWGERRRCCTACHSG
jgi:hypothetical protein